MKLLRALWYMLTFRYTKALNVLNMNVGVRSATWDKIVEDKKNQLITYKDAVSALVAQQEEKKLKLKDLTAEMQTLAQKKAGALVVAQKRVAALGNDKAKCDADQQYIEAKRFFADFSSTLDEKQKRAEQLDADIKDLGDRVNKHTTDMKLLVKKLDDLKSEKQEDIAEVISAKEQQKAAELEAGLTQDRTSADLAMLRDTRNKIKAGVKVSQTLAGIDNRSAEDTFLKEAQSSQTDNEFDKLMGLKTPAATETTTDAPVTAGPLPEK